MKTRVIFRRMRDGSIIAFFPALAGDLNPERTCLSYQTIGQHGAADVTLMRNTYAATPEEYKDLQDELTSLGYDLEVTDRFCKKDREARRLEVGS